VRIDLVNNVWNRKVVSVFRAAVYTEERDAAKLQETVVKLIPYNVCSRPDWYGNVFQHRQIVCAGYESGGKDGCVGDGGGPLQCVAKDARWRLVGVSTGGDGCAKPKKPGIYTKINDFDTYHWIRLRVKVIGHIVHVSHCKGPFKLQTGQREWPCA